MTVAASNRDAFIRAHTRLGRPPLTPEIQLWLAAEATALWEASEAFLEETGLPPPFWAFAWAGGQALARYVLDRPEVVLDRRILDFGAGGGLVAIAALQAGAAAALAVDVDPFAAAAVRMNGAANGCRPNALTADATSLDPAEFDVVLAADVCYDRRQSEPASAWLRRAAAADVTVLIGDPGRTYLLKDGLTPVADYVVPTPKDLERESMTPTRVWRLEAGK